MGRFLLIVGVALSFSAPAPGGDADAMRVWTDWNGKSFRGKLSGFETASFRLTLRDGEVCVDGTRWDRLDSQRQRLVDFLLEDENITDPRASLAKAPGRARELSYLQVLFTTEDGSTRKLPLETLQGSADKTGDYRRAADESLHWLTQRQQEDRQRDESEAQRRSAEGRQRESEMRREEELRRRMARPPHHHHASTWYQREQLERKRRDLARREADLKAQQHRLQDQQKAANKSEQPKAAPKKDVPKNPPKKNDPPKKSPPKKDHPKKDQPKKNSGGFP